jgi:hypothetical protein
MATRRVLMCLMPERSSYNSALIVAGHLRAHGHSVVLAGADVPELQRHAQRHGLEHLSVAPDPRGFAARHAQAASGLARLQLQREYQRDVVSAWEVFARRRDHGFDLAFCDVLATKPMAFALSELGIPTLVLHTSYASRFSSQCPPVFSTLIAGEQRPAWSRRLAFLLAWSRVPIVRNLDVRRPGSWLKAPPRLLAEQTFAFAGAHARAKRNGWRFCYSEWGARYAGPEVVIGHRALDWPILQASEQRCYLAQQATPRMDEDADWRAGLDLGKTLVYCNASTLLPDREEDLTRVSPRLLAPFRRYFDALIEAFRARTDWQVLVACGGLATTYAAVPLPPHIRVVRRVPQLQVLEHADLVITPGGPATVRECVAAGVPMVVFPGWTDQLGNAARVQHFGLGVDGGDFRRATRDRISELVARVLDDPTIAAAVAAAKASVVDRETEWQGLRAFVQRHLGVTL